jgi:RimJ/RimL family protein N-acetyltransferase
MTTPTLTTDRLLLRPFQEDDFAAVHAYASDPEVCRYMSWGPNDEAETRAHLVTKAALAREATPSDYVWAVTLRESEVLIGSCDLHPTAVRTYKAELGYCYRRDSWGQGYATEAAAAMVDFGFRGLGLHRISAGFFAPNVASGRVIEKLGMQYEGRLREAVQKNGEWYDMLLYAILEHEWAGANHAHPRP